MSAEAAIRRSQYFTVCSDRSSTYVLYVPYAEWLGNRLQKDQTQSSARSKLGQMFTLENLLRRLPPFFHSYFFSLSQSEPLSGLFLKDEANKNTAEVNILCLHRSFR